MEGFGIGVLVLMVVLGFVLWQEHRGNKVVIGENRRRHAEEHDNAHSWLCVQEGFGGDCDARDLTKRPHLHSACGWVMTKWRAR